MLRFSVSLVSLYTKQKYESIYLMWDTLDTGLGTHYRNKCKRIIMKCHNIKLIMLEKHTFFFFKEVLVQVFQMLSSKKQSLFFHKEFNKMLVKSTVRINCIMTYYSIHIFPLWSHYLKLTKFWEPWCRPGNPSVYIELLSNNYFTS